MRTFLKTTSTLLAFAAGAAALISLNTDASGGFQTIHPQSAMAMALASWAIGRAAE